MAEKGKTVAVGIDFGTSTCSVAVVRDDGQVEVIPNERGSKTTPSYVAFTKAGRLVGEDAFEHVLKDPKNTVFALKRLIGLDPKSASEEVKNLNLPFELYTNESDKTVIKVEYKSKIMEFTPEQIVAMLFSKMKRIAEKHLACEVNTAVISVPASFNSCQRQATVNAAKIAGFKKVELLNDSGAALIYCGYFLGKELVYRNCCLVDFGGGYLSITAAKIGSIYLKVDHSTVIPFGGFDVDCMIARDFCYKNSIEKKGLLSADMLENLRFSCNTALHQLSNHEETSIQFNSPLIGGYSQTLKKTRIGDLDECRIRKLFNRALSKVAKPDEVKYVIFNGGGSSLNYLREVTVNHFPKAQVMNLKSKESLIVCGAALKAASLNGLVRVPCIESQCFRRLHIDKILDGRVIYEKCEIIRYWPKEFDAPLNVECNVVEEVDSASIENENSFVFVGKIITVPSSYSFNVKNYNKVSVSLDGNGILKVNSVYSSIIDTKLKLNYCNESTSNELAIENELNEDDRAVERHNKLMEICLTLRREASERNRLDVLQEVGSIEHWAMDNLTKVDEFEAHFQHLRAFERLLKATPNGDNDSNPKTQANATSQTGNIEGPDGNKIDNSGNKLVGDKITSNNSTDPDTSLNHTAISSCESNESVPRSSRVLVGQEHRHGCTCRDNPEVGPREEFKSSQKCENDQRIEDNQTSNRYKPSHNQTDDCSKPNGNKTQIKNEDTTTNAPVTSQNNPSINNSHNGGGPSVATSKNGSYPRRDCTDTAKVNDNGNPKKTPASQNLCTPDQKSHNGLQNLNSTPQISNEGKAMPAPTNHSSATDKTIGKSASVISSSTNNRTDHTSTKQPILDKCVNANQERNTNSLSTTSNKSQAQQQSNQNKSLEAEVKQNNKKSNGGSYASARSTPSTKTGTRPSSPGNVGATSDSHGRNIKHPQTASGVKDGTTSAEHEEDRNKTSPVQYNGPDPQTVHSNIRHTEPLDRYYQGGHRVAKQFLPKIELKKGGNFKPALGIDLGTSKCCVGFVKNGKVQILEFDTGKTTMPSFVSFTDVERLIGETARDKFGVNALNTVIGSKLLLGKHFTPELASEITQLFSSKVENEDGKPVFAVDYKNKPVRLTPEQVCAMLLTKLKNLAESQLQEKVTDVVIAVPAYFDYRQRQSVLNAAQIADLTVLSLINDCTAAALNYQENNSGKSGNVLVIDAGGGGFSTAIIGVDPNGVNVKGVGGTSEISGTRIDKKLVEYVVQQLQMKKKINLNDKKDLEKLRLNCEKVKQNLSILKKDRISIENSNDGYKRVDISISRSEFQDQILPDVEQIITKLLKEFLSDTGISKRDIDEVLLVGGCSRIPALQDAVHDFFGDKMFNKTVNADEAVAYGASIFAASLSGDPFLRDVGVTDIVPNRLYPNRDCCKWIKVPQSESECLVCNGVPFYVTPHGIVYDGKYFSEENIYNKTSIVSRSSDVIRKFDEDDKSQMELSHAINEFEAYCLETEKLVENNGSIPIREREKMISKIREACEWVYDQERNISKDDVCKTREALKKEVQKLYQKGSLKVRTKIHLTFELDSAEKSKLEEVMEAACTEGNRGLNELLVEYIKNKNFELNIGE